MGTDRPLDHETLVVSAAARALATLDSPPSVLELLERHGLDVLERATTLAADTEARGKLLRSVGATLIHYLTAEKIPGRVPLTFAQLIERHGRGGCPSWITPYLVGVKPSRPEAWEADREPEPRRADGGIESGASLARSLVASWRETERQA